MVKIKKILCGAPPKNWGGGVVHICVHCTTMAAFGGKNVEK